jgi:hypothetical protein
MCRPTTGLRRCRPRKAAAGASRLWHIDHSRGYGFLPFGWYYTERPGRGPPSDAAILVFVLLLSVVSTAVRIWYPIDRWKCTVHIYLYPSLVSPPFSLANLKGALQAARTHEWCRVSVRLERQLAGSIKKGVEL